MKHFIVLQTLFTPKNKAHSALIDFVKQYDRLLLELKDFDSFVIDLKKGLDLINRNHRRCNDLHMISHRPRFDKKEWAFHANGVFTLIVYCSKNDL
jgi:hypothetical protein